MAAPRTVLVTGALGFLGRAVCRALVDAGNQVLATWHRQAPALDHPAIRWIRADLTAADPLSGEGGVEFACVMHLAAVLPTGTVTPEDAARVNRRIDETVFRIAAVRRATVVYASGTSVYGELRGDASVAEDATATPIDPYPMAKLAGERSGAEIVGAAGGRFVSLRVCAPYGPEQAARTVLQVFIERALKAESVSYYGSGSREQSFTFVTDATAAFLLALDTGEGCYNIAGGPPVTMKELAFIVAELARAPARLVQAAGSPDPQEGLRARFDTRRAARELGWVQRVALREGIARCLAARRSGALA